MFSKTIKRRTMHLVFIYKESYRAYERLGLVWIQKMFLTKIYNNNVLTGAQKHDKQDHQGKAASNEHRSRHYSFVLLYKVT
jgi:hypothetical protein